VSRRLLVINVALGIVSVVLAVVIFRTLLAKRPLPPPSASKAVSAPAPAPAAPAADVGPDAYGVIAARNLFNPNRSETAAVATAPATKPPILYGIVMNGSKSRAFLEDPAFKRVAGYSVGDTVGGGTIQKIADDRVVIVRPEGGLLEVLLQDPSKPRATPAATAAQAGSAQAGPGQAGAGQAGAGQAGPGQAGAAQVGPGQAGSPPSPGQPAIRPGRQRIPLQGQQPGND
jgi:hypothetical protein